MTDDDDNKPDRFRDVAWWIAWTGIAMLIIAGLMTL